MNGPQVIWRLGRWIGAHGTGIMRLSWAGGSLVLRVARGKVVGAEGPDPGLIASRLGGKTAGNADLLAEARAVARAMGVDETEAVATAKAVVEEAVRSWILDPGRSLDVEDEAVEAGGGPTISLPHALVEMMLAGDGDDLASMILPDPGVLLRRSPGFLERYASLRLAEEADLIVAKVTGQRTADEIARRSPHGPGEVLRLLAALVIAGLLEPVPVAAVAPTDIPLDPTAITPAGPPRRLRFAWIVTAVIVLCLVLAAIAWTVIGHRSRGPSSSARWGVVVDSGCRPRDLQRILQAAGRHPAELIAQRQDRPDGEACWELVWGRFTSRGEAEAAEASVPKSLLHKGFKPVVVRITAALPTSPGGE